MVSSNEILELVALIPVMDRSTGQFFWARARQAGRPKMVSSNEILELVALMDEIREEAQRMARLTWRC